MVQLLSGGHRVALAGGEDSLPALALAARDLKEGSCTTHPRTGAVTTWGDLQDYAAYDPAGRDLQPL
ncbi:DNA helicase, partial [Streptomyces nigra]